MHKKISFYFVFTAVLTSTLYSSYDFPKNKEIQIRQYYRKNMQKHCGFTLAKFAQYHTEEEWKSKKINKNFFMELSKICPRGVSYLRDDRIEYLFMFLEKYASDKARPKC